jgi:alpha-tubulin suppressor-like RCC1 family protein
MVNTGALECWGYNGDGELGVGDNASTRNSPDQVINLVPGPRSVSEGRAHTCAVLTDNTVECWGSNFYGQLGIGTVDAVPHTMDVPTGLVALGRPATVVAAGGSHTCALLNDNSLKCWGDNTHGQLGLGDTTARPQPTALPINLGAGRSAKFVTYGDGDHVCVILDNGTVKCWGRNDQGQLGLGDIVNRGGTGGTGVVASLPTVDVAGTR